MRSAYHPAAVLALQSRLEVSQRCNTTITNATAFFYLHRVRSHLRHLVFCTCDLYSFSYGPPVQLFEDAISANCALDVVDGLIKRRLQSTIPSFSSPMQQGVSQSQRGLYHHHHGEDESRPERPLYPRNRRKITNTCYIILQ